MTMTTARPPATTRLCKSTADDILVRDRSLPRELIGKLGFTEMMCWVVLGRVPDGDRIALIDACLVALMEHGLTPSALSARLVYGSAPEAVQGAVAAGLLAVGGVFVGTSEGCARLLARIAGAADAAGEAAAVVEEHRRERRALPGFGHPLHAPDDPRAPVLLGLARARGVAGRHVGALEALSAALDRALGRHVTVNATGAVAAVLADCDIPVEIMRGFALVARCAGLVGHVHEEQQRPAMSSIWEAAEQAVAYDGNAASIGEEKP